MKTAHFFHYAACSQCRATRQLLEQKQYSLTPRDFFKQPFTEPELRALLKKSKLKPRDIFSTKSPSIKFMHLDPATLSNDEMLQLMLKEPRLIRRPLTLIDNRLIIGSDKSAIERL